MAKQTFTTGQVLTAAEMTSLQQTAMGGGSATAKTASYVLTAADAGTTVIMNSGSATSITVNTGLFSAGDTVFIVNQGSGVCTVTAGTATVDTASSLALNQYETGELYFLSASSAIFSEYQQAASSGGGLTLLSTTSLSGSTTTVSSISGSYKNLILIVKNVVTSADSNQVYMRMNGITTSNYAYGAVRNINTTVQGVASMATDKWQVFDRTPSTSGVLTTANGRITIYRYTDTDFVFGDWQTNGSNNVGADFTNSAGTGKFDNTAAITSVTLFPDSGTFTGTLYIYGEN